MTLNLADAPSVPYLAGAVGQEQVLCAGTFTLGAAGAISTSVVDDPALTLAADSGTGVHALTFPICVSAKIKVQLVSSGLTVSEATVTASDATAGTATIKLTKAGTAAQAASGNIIYVTVIGKVR